MKKLILCVLATIAIYAILYGLFAFVHMDFNPNEWRIDTRVFYCFFATAVSVFANMGIILYDEKKS
mgnify:CR=1